MRVLPILMYPPRFRSAEPSYDGGATYPPRDPRDMGAFAAALVRRYGPNGTYWSDHPDVPRLPISAWQVWNEPNLEGFWGNAPDPAAYTNLLRVVSGAIRGADPGAEVVTAGIPDSKLSGAIPMVDFINSMYDAGARGTFDTLAIHGYAPDEQGTLALLRRARGIMDAHGDNGTLRLTEFGWATDGPGSEFTTDEPGQAHRITCALTAFAAQRDALGLRGVVYFNWRDYAPPSGSNWDNWIFHAGLMHRDGSAKPGYGAFQDTALKLEDPSNPATGCDPASGDVTSRDALGNRGRTGARGGTKGARSSGCPRPATARRARHRARKHARARVRASAASTRRGARSPKARKRKRPGWACMELPQQVTFRSAPRPSRSERAATRAKPAGRRPRAG
jgi:hypothetical protein